MTDPLSIHRCDLWLVRHGESLGNVDGSEGDTALSPRGVEQAVALGRELRAQPFVRAYVSPLRRARETLEHALPCVPIVVDPRLTEFRPRPTRVLDLADVDPRELARLARATPEGDWETGGAFKSRIRSFLDELPTTGSVLVVAHFAVVREILGSRRGFRELPQTIEHCVVHRIPVRGQG